MRWTLALGALVLGVVAEAALQQPRADLLQLVESERAFATLSARDGTRTAFLAFLAQGAVVFDPQPTDGRALHETRPASEDRLEWRPALAGIASSGDLGYTSGPWRYRRAGAATSEAHGHYVSVWQRQADGTWRVVADIGISHPLAGDGPEDVEYVDVPGPPSSRADEPSSSARLESVLEADRTFSRHAASRGIVNAYASYLADFARVYRSPSLPLPRAEALDLIGELDRPETVGSTADMSIPWTWMPRGGAVSGAADLAFTYGTARPSPTPAGAPEPHSYLRIWRRFTDGWRVEIDVMIPAARP